MKQIRFLNCPNCRKRQIVQMPDDWQAQVEAGAAIPIVGCGNPWHYRFPEERRWDRYVGPQPVQGIER